MRRKASKKKTKTRKVQRVSRKPARARVRRKRIRRTHRRISVVGPTTAGYSLLSGGVLSTLATSTIPSLPPPHFDPTPAVRALLGTNNASVAFRDAITVESCAAAPSSPYVLRLQAEALPRVSESWKLSSGEEPNFVPEGPRRTRAIVQGAALLPLGMLAAYLEAVAAGARVVGGIAEFPVRAIRSISPWKDRVEDIGGGPPVVASGVMVSRRTKGFSLPHGWHRAIAPFVLLAVAITIPLHGFSAVAAVRASKSKVVSSARAAGDQFRQAAISAASSDLETAARELESGRMALASAKQDLERLPALARELASLLPRNRKALAAGEALLSSGAALAEAASTLASEFTRLGDDTNSTYKITVISNAAEAALPSLAVAATALRSINTNVIPSSQRDTFVALRGGIIKAESVLRELIPLGEAVTKLLGRDAPRRYLVVFQNSNELRPTGGFMGSFAELTIHRGAVERLVVPPGGAYDIQGQQTALVLPPDPLRLIAGRWQFHDANWFPDFPTSAKKIQWFYEKSGGPSTDGVIAVNSTVLPELLRIVGPITIPDGRSFSSDTVLAAMQNEVESPAAREGGRPKALVGELAAIIMERLAQLPADRFLPAAEVLGSALRSKRILLYSTDSGIQEVIARQNWDGGIPQGEGDFLGLVTANIGGEKTDTVIDEVVEHESAIAADGTVTDTVVVRRTHAGLRGASHTGVRNYSYLRLYVPKGSALVDAVGDFRAPPPEEFEGADPVYAPDAMLAAMEAEQGYEPQSGTRVTEEFGKTVFGNWMILEPGESRVIRYSYRLPFRLALPAPSQDIRESVQRFFHGEPGAAYRLTLWHQPGAERRAVGTSLRLPSGFRVAWQTPRERPLESGLISSQTRDVFVGAVITP